ncbi:TPA: hypothetical protein ACKRRR_002942 [Pseudomonas aeruginosa]|uniref:hypothetical protein n=1 Tax=Pseudomonas aeruginosa TaxID=287 RepID=UPI000FFE5B92|nr:hypothetical protein [Pseudomonas aeruginosa]MBH4435593.1 hypothetical protein [Pseudomonas aeruginosa]HCF3492092.1 hypothetical protein [Pseudomonas aeruginosa]
MDLEREKSRARMLVVLGWVVASIFIVVFLVSALKSIAISLDGSDFFIAVNVKNLIIELYRNTQYPVIGWVWEYSPVFYNYQISSLFTFSWLVVFLGLSLGGGLIYIGKRILREHSEAENNARKSKLTEAYRDRLG